MTLEEVREEFIRVASAFARSYEGRKEAERLLGILRNDGVRDALATCLNERIVKEAFTWAGYRGDVDLLQAFCDIGMNVDAKDARGTSALKNACLNGLEESVCWLLDHGANVNIQDNFGTTSLMSAGAYEKIKVMEMMLQRNANPDVQDDNGWTALMFASQEGHKEVVELLLNVNADINLKNNEGEIALDLAGNDEIKEMFQSHVTTSYVLK